MRWLAACTLAGLCVALARGVRADPPPGTPAPPSAARAKPMSFVQAADAVLATLDAKDTPRLAALAMLDQPDPWLVADELVGRGHPEAAAAFSRAAPRPDVARLSEVLAVRKHGPQDDVIRKTILASWATQRNDPAKALAMLDVLEPPQDPLLACRLAGMRGLVLRALRRFEESLAALEACAAAAEQLGWPARVSFALQEGGVTLYASGDYRRTLAIWERWLAAERTRGFDPGLAEALSAVSLAHGRLGANEQALEESRAALALFERLGLESRAAAELGSLGAIQFSQGDFRGALEAFQKSLVGAERGGAPYEIAIALMRIGTAHNSVGDHAAAIPLLERSVKLARQFKGGTEGETGALHGLGIAHRGLGDLLAARAAFEEAMQTAERAGRPDLGLGALGSMGHVHFALGDYEQALAAYQRALERSQARGLVREAGIYVGNLARARQQMGHLDEAHALSERALRMAEAAGDLDAAHMARMNLGILHVARFQSEQGLPHLERALAYFEQRGNAASASLCRLSIAQIHADAGRFPEAIQTALLALADSERAQSLENRRSAWAHLAIFKLSAGDTAGAVAAARSALADARLLVRGQAEEQQATGRVQAALIGPIGATAAAQLGDAATLAFFLESGRAAALLEALSGREAVRAITLPQALQRADVDAVAAEQQALQRHRVAVATGDQARIAALAAEVAHAREARKQVFERIQREAKAAAHVTQPEPDALPAIQARLRSDEALVLYLTGEENLQQAEALALVVTQGGARIVRLGEPKGIDAALAACLPDGPAHDLAGPAQTLRKHLVAPLGLTPATKRLLVSPTGALAYVPFAVLTDLPVCYVPSGSTLGVLQADSARSGKGVLALGDPDHATPGQGSGSARGLDLARLPGTREEARAVGDVVLLGAEATPSRLVAALAERTRWHAVHLACHGFVDPDRPTFSRLALAPDAKSDGFLTALDVLRLRVPADLVVLSACETGKGKIVQGEGVLGLTRAFMYAGAPRVLVSLWKVDDAATRLLMERFYVRWNQQKLGAAAALRGAQEAVRDFEEEVVDVEASRAAGHDVRAKKRPYAAAWYWAGWALWGLPE